MNYAILIIIGIAGIVLGAYFRRHQGYGGQVGRRRVRGKQEKESLDYVWSNSREWYHKLTTIKRLNGRLPLSR